MRGQHVITAEHLTKRYGRHTAVDDISFTVERGEIVGFLGPNGAGKSTTMNIVTGYLSSSEGTVTVDGLDVLDHPEEVKRRIGYLPENPPLYTELTVNEYLRFVGEIKKLSRGELKRNMEQIVELVKIGDVRKRLIRNLSKGYKQRVGLAQALMGNPQVLVLDEPTSGLDPKQINEMRTVIKDLGKEHTIILSSHILPEVSAVCERVLIIDRGRLVADDTTENLSRGLTGSHLLGVRVAGSEERVTEMIRAIPGVKRVDVKPQVESGTVELVVESETDADVRREIFYAMSKASTPIVMMRSLELTLEEIFLNLTMKE
jgi:ABC-2 type transport system ATP-binding protein